MKKFVFSLQRLYDVKAADEKQKRLELKELTRILDEHKRNKQELLQKFAQEKEKYDDKSKSGMTRQDLKNFGDYFQYLNEEIDKQNRYIAEWEQKVEICKQELVKLMNEQKALERMREEQLEEYNTELQKSEEKEIEDFMQGRQDDND
ncbi:MAG: flagellar export protein FliJ [Christensenellaceae bacterium]|jgi:flagellar FliJ protein